MCKIPGMSGKQARLQQIADANEKAATEAKQAQVAQSQSNDGSPVSSGAQVAPGVTVLGQDNTLEGRYAGIGTRNVRMSKTGNIGRRNSSDPASGVDGDGGDRKKKRVSTGLGL